jgi:hypothetical protein
VLTAGFCALALPIAGGPEKLVVLMEGESLFNDASGKWLGAAAAPPAHDSLPEEIPWGCPCTAARVLAPSLALAHTHTSMHTHAHTRARAHAYAAITLFEVLLTVLEDNLAPGEPFPSVWSIVPTIITDTLRRDQPASPPPPTHTHTHTAAGVVPTLL